MVQTLEVSIISYGIFLICGNIFYGVMFSFLISRDAKFVCLIRVGLLFFPS